MEVCSVHLLAAKQDCVRRYEYDVVNRTLLSFIEARTSSLKNEALPLVEHNYARPLECPTTVYAQCHLR